MRNTMANVKTGDVIALASRWWSVTAVRSWDEFGIPRITVDVVRVAESGKQVKRTYTVSASQPMRKAA